MIDRLAGCDTPGGKSSSQIICGLYSAVFSFPLPLLSWAVVFAPRKGRTSFVGPLIWGAEPVQSGAELGLGFAAPVALCASRPPSRPRYWLLVRCCCCSGAFSLQIRQRLGLGGPATPQGQVRFNALGPACISTLPQSKRVLLFGPWAAVGLRLYLEGFLLRALGRLRLSCQENVERRPRAFPTVTAGGRLPRPQPGDVLEPSLPVGGTPLRPQLRGVVSTSRQRQPTFCL